MSHSAFNAYRNMWLFVYFDLPTKTADERKRYTAFRKFLISDGFEMQQYSVYTRFCLSRQSLETHQNRVIKNLPESGYVSMIELTDKQFSRIIHHYGTKKKDPPAAPQQLLMF